MATTTYGIATSAALTTRTGTRSNVLFAALARTHRCSMLIHLQSQLLLVLAQLLKGPGPVQIVVAQMQAFIGPSAVRAGSYTRTSMLEILAIYLFPTQYILSACWASRSLPSMLTYFWFLSFFSLFSQPLLVLYLSRVHLLSIDSLVTCIICLIGWMSAFYISTLIFVLLMAFALFFPVRYPSRPSCLPMISPFAHCIFGAG
jgi:hypothetical protein